MTGTTCSMVVLRCEIDDVVLFVGDTNADAWEYCKAIDLESMSYDKLCGLAGSDVLKIDVALVHAVQIHGYRHGFLESMEPVRDVEEDEREKGQQP